MPGLAHPDTVYGALEAVERTGAHHLAVVSGAVRLRYGELRGEVDRLAAALIASGVTPGDRVAMLCSTRIEYWTSFLASAAIGAIWLGLGIRNRFEELDYILGDAEPRLLIALSAFEGRDYAVDLRRLRDRVGSIQDIVTIGGAMDSASRWAEFAQRGSGLQPGTIEEAAIRVRPDDPALMVYTSGTTGRPKGALLSHFGLVAGSRAQMTRDVGHRPVIINAFPINHIACVGDTSMANMVAGGATILAERFDPRQQLELIEQERVTVWGGIPAMVQMTLAVEDFASFDLSSLRVVGWGGGAMPRDVIERLMQLAPRIGALYGLTESTCNVTWTEPGASMDVMVSTIGKPGPEFACRIVDEAGSLCGIGVPGEIQFKAATNMLGYWRRPEATSAAFSTDGWLRTGDLGVWRPDGNLTLVGRRIEMFKSGGFNVYPREVELALESHAGVGGAAVVPRPDRLYNEVGHAFVMLRGENTPSAADLEVFLRRQLANYKVPKTIELVDALPVLENGKIDRMRLRRLASQAGGA